MTKQNFQIHNTGCLIQGLENSESFTMHFTFFKVNSSSHRQAKPILAAIVKEVISKGKVDTTMQEICTAWTKLTPGQEEKALKRMFMDKGEQLISIFDHQCSCIHYFILSALLNAKRKKEDIKLYTYEQIGMHAESETTLEITDHPALKEIFLIIKFLLEQDLIPLAIAIASEQTDLSGFNAQQVEVVTAIVKMLKDNIHQTNLDTVQVLLNGFTNFKAPNMFAEFAKAEESHMYRWIIGGIVVGVVAILGIVLVAFNREIYPLFFR